MSPQRPRRGAKEKKRKAMRQVRATPRRNEVKKDPEFVGLVHFLPCCAIGLAGHVCSGPIEAHHAGSKHDHGYGVITDDDTAIPLCKGAHDVIEGMERGELCGMSGKRLRAWEMDKIIQTRISVERMRCAPGPRSEIERPW